MIYTADNCIYNVQLFFTSMNISHCFSNINDASKSFLYSCFLY